MGEGGPGSAQTFLGSSWGLEGTRMARDPWCPVPRALEVIPSVPSALEAGPGANQGGAGAVGGGTLPR